jgi:hypothetical protein
MKHSESEDEPKTLKLQVIATAESTEEKMKTSYEKWSTTGGPEENFVNTGISDQQVALGKANYLMDTVR